MSNEKTVAIPEDLREEYENAAIGSQNYGNSVTGAEYRMRMRHIERITALTAEVDALKAEWRCPACDGRDRVSSGPDLVCLHCTDVKKIEELQAVVARLSAPVTDAEWYGHTYWQQDGGMRSFVNCFILARATPPQDVEKS